MERLTFDEINISFDPDENIIYLLVSLYGPEGQRRAYCALDTGATTALVLKPIETA